MCPQRTQDPASGTTFRVHFDWNFSGGNRKFMRHVESGRSVRYRRDLSLINRNSIASSDKTLESARGVRGDEANFEFASCCDRFTSCCFNQVHLTPTTNRVHGKFYFPWFKCHFCGRKDVTAGRPFSVPDLQQVSVLT